MHAEDGFQKLEVCGGSGDTDTSPWLRKLWTVTPTSHPDRALSTCSVGSRSLSDHVCGFGTLPLLLHVTAWAWASASEYVGETVIPEYPRVTGHRAPRSAISASAQGPYTRQGCVCTEPMHIL